MNIQDLAGEYGVKNLRFFIPMHRLEMIGFIPGITLKSSSSPEEVVECVINEDRYKVAEGYKITLRAAGDFEVYYGQEHYYQSDFTSMLRESAARGDERYRVYLLSEDGYSRINFS